MHVCTAQLPVCILVTVLASTSRHRHPNTHGLPPVPASPNLNLNLNLSLHACCLRRQAGLDLPQLLHAGLFVAGCVGLLGASQAIDLFNWLVPPPVIRGVQLAVGVKLAMKVKGPKEGQREGYGARSVHA